MDIPFAVHLGSRERRTVQVLHVVDRLGGGVPKAVADYIRNSPDDFSHIIAAPFTDGVQPSNWDGLNVRLFDFGFGHLTRIRRLRQICKTANIGVIHAHSSFAGMYTRLALSTGRLFIVYSPHCFAFERRDVGAMARLVFRRTEKLLARNTDIVVACGPGEAIVARQLYGTSVRTMLVPNVSSIEPGTAKPWDGGPLKVAMAGRISAQKSPDYFEEVAAKLTNSGVLMEPTWIGEGVGVSAESLLASDVRVTGWLSSDDLRGLLLEQHVYLHTAAWEGFPLAVLDAHAVRLPTLVRAINAFPDLPFELTIEGGMSVLRNVLSGYSDFTFWAQRNLDLWDNYLSENTKEKQKSMLRQVWGSVATPRKESQRGSN